MRTEVRNNWTERADVPRRALAVLVALCLVLGQMNGGMFVAYATSGTPVTIQVGANVTAELSDGVLRLSGTGDTDDFTADTAPFKDHAGEIRTLVVEEGVTYLGAHLFSGLGGLGGELTLPKSIVGFGESVFSGLTQETSPHFFSISNLFESGEVVRPAQQAEPQQPEPEPAAELVSDVASAEDAPAEPAVAEGEVLAEQPAGPELLAPAADEPEQQPTEQAPEPTPSPDEGYTVEQIVQQEIANPETLFASGQTGTVTCSDQNAAFLNAALAAGYQPAGEEPAALDAPAESESVAEAPASETSGEVTIVYVDQASGKDENDGKSETSAVQTLEAAAKLLKLKADGGTVETNVIAIVGTYECVMEKNKGKELFKERPVPVTLKGADKNALLSVKDPAKEDNSLTLFEDFCLEYINVNSIDHIYGQGHNVTIGDGVSNTTLFYLYGFGRADLKDSGDTANLTVKSGKFNRIVGYVRNMANLDGARLKSEVTIEGTADILTVVAGNASGAVKNANVAVNVKGGTVKTLIGGNQGFSSSPASFSGKTTINVSGGVVDDLFGAGSGRNRSVPTYQGSLDINMTGGKVTNLHGSGSAAYVVSGGGDPTEVSIALAGGDVTNVFAAGYGWDTSSKLGWLNDEEGSFADDASPNDFGSLTGNVRITVSDGATVGNIYASGRGYQNGDGSAPNDGTKKNAYLDGNATINVKGGTVTGNVYGGGKGIADGGYEQCARVTEDSHVEVSVAGGTVEGNVYGGGEIADVLGSTSVILSSGTVKGKVFGGGKVSDVGGSTSVTLSGATVQGNLYGGGEEGKVEGSTTVNVHNGTVNSSVYGGAYGKAKQVLVLDGSTVNMTGGWVRGNVYGGSEFSDDGADDGKVPDPVITNLVGGAVDGNVFGGGYQGTVHGSTHLHIGEKALGACEYYGGHQDKIPKLTLSTLSVKGSVYAGGDFGGEGNNYDAITVEGTSHVYIDGEGYDTSDAGTDLSSMTLGSGVFGSGASCDAGETRLVTLKDYGAAVPDTDGEVTRTLSAIQRADRVSIINSHVKLIGQSDVANVDTTARYSLNRIGDDEEINVPGFVNGLVLQNSTLILEAPAMELAALRSLNAEGSETASGSPSNTLLLDTGTLLSVSYTAKDGSKTYGPVKGYARLLAGASAEGIVYARISPSDENDGGFVDKDGKKIDFTEVQPDHRYWKVRGKGESVNVERQAVLIARTLTDGAGGDGFSVAKGVIELPPAEKGSTYTVKSVEVSNPSLKLVEAAKTGQQSDATWKTSEDNAVSGGDEIVLADQQKAISKSALDTFGLFMAPGNGFADAAGTGKVISARSIAKGDKNTVIETQVPGSVSGDNATSQIEFYLTYSNEGITASQDLGAVKVVLERTHNGGKRETITANVQIVTRTTSLTALAMDLYATQTGSYTGTLYIPAGAKRELSLTGVDKGNVSLVVSGTTLTDNDFSLTMQTVRDQGWAKMGSMEEPCDLGSFKDPVDIGTTDSRYDAPIKFTLSNATGFTSKQPDAVMLTLKEGGAEGKEVPVTLRIHWEESAVKAVTVGAGRQYNGLPQAGTPTISKKSSLTTVFELSKSLQPTTSWIELQNEGKATVLPRGTEFTLLSNGVFYRYRATGVEDESKIFLNSFSLMEDGSKLSGSLSGNITVIVDFGSSASEPGAGDYSLRMRTNESADSVGADFTMDNSTPTATVNANGGKGLSRGTHEFTVNVQPGSDTRFTDGAAVVLSSGDSEGFPEGTVFWVGGEEYYPVNDKVSIPLGAGTSWNIVMDTTNTTGLTSGEHKLSAQVLPAGANAGNATPLPVEAATYTITENPSHSLSVALDAGSSRIVKPGAQLIFTADTKPSSESISVSVQEKKGNAYEGISDWVVSSATSKITVTVPSGTTEGTYRLLFKLGDQEVPYNIIVTD